MLFVALFLVSLSRSVSPSSRGGAGDKKISIVTDLLGWWCTADGSLSLPYVKKKGWRLMKMMLVAALFYSGAAAWGGGGCSTSFGYPAPGSPVSPVDALCGSSAEIKERNEARSRANKGKKARLDSDCRPHVVEDLLESLLKSRVVRFLRRVVVSIVVGCVADALGIGNAVFFAQLSVQWVKAGKGRMGSAGMNWSQRVVIVVGLWLCFGSRVVAAADSSSSSSAGSGCTDALFSSSSSSSSSSMPYSTSTGEADILFLDVNLADDNRTHGNVAFQVRVAVANRNQVMRSRNVHDSVKKGVDILGGINKNRMRGKVRGVAFVEFFSDAMKTQLQSTSAVIAISGRGKLPSGRSPSRKGNLTPTRDLDQVEAKAKVYSDNPETSVPKAVGHSQHSLFMMQWWSFRFSKGPPGLL
eukprot:TRINITY_DN1179_c0_g1_i10.p1 TRINITY_DN1179_c0_g1~~TRINITY_DN1179_c0_g1_i10.p1  ORF type:complete len:482 (-),score=-43.02 TRINITY_DN1179_c0_g1_i10:575-1813(-)